MLLIAVAGAFVSRTAAEDQAVDDARRINGVIARTVVEPHLRDGLLTGDPAALARHARGRDPAHRRPGAADEAVDPGRADRLLRRRAPRRQAVPAGARRGRGAVTGEAAAEISDLSRAENDLERDLGTLLEVYRPVHTPSGQVLLFETYMPLSSLAARTSAIWLQFLPITIGALVLLQLVQFPLAVRLARQTARARRDRELMLYRSLAASDAERRRIAADLHDGVVQDLAATSIALAGAAVEAEQAGSRDESGRLHVAADAVRAAIRSLRSLVVDIHPPNLRRTGLAAALGDLAATTTARGVAVTLVVDDGATRRLPAPRSSSRSGWRRRRCATSSRTPARGRRGATGRQAGADGDLLSLAVTDDGAGFDPAAVAPDDRPHLGLRLLDDLAGDVGGRIDVTSAPGAGTTVTMEVPVS